MSLEKTVRRVTESDAARVIAFDASDVQAILRERRWLVAAATVEHTAWMAEAAALLGPHAGDRDALAGLLALVFEYDAQPILRSPDAHNVLARQGAREVIRELAHMVLESGTVDSERFKELIEALKARVRWRSRDLFHPIRLALAGRTGEGELDRVILLCDSAARLPFAVPVKSVRQRLLTFCAALN